MFTPHISTLELANTEHLHAHTRPSADKAGSLRIRGARYSIDNHTGIVSIRIHPGFAKAAGTNENQAFLGARYPVRP
ncbi:hypothetical protein [Cupriavidus sp. RAF12]|uniref:hypothetical protein n=1 Tax=Cupriavidus sp. RAF12 TaxID=3233050 RepID=UPI003F8F1957